MSRWSPVKAKLNHDMKLTRNNTGGRGRYRTADRWCVKGQNRVHGRSTVSSTSRSACPLCPSRIGACTYVRARLGTQTGHWRTGVRQCPVVQTGGPGEAADRLAGLPNVPMPVDGARKSGKPRIGLGVGCRPDGVDPHFGSAGCLPASFRRRRVRRRLARVTCTSRGGEHGRYVPPAWAGRYPDANASPKPSWQLFPCGRRCGARSYGSAAPSATTTRRQHLRYINARYGPPRSRPRRPPVPCWTSCAAEHPFRRIHVRTPTLISWRSDSH
jgi:hypothetical protein